MALNPYDCKIKPPDGIASITLQNYHQIKVLNEVFCRRCYSVNHNAKVVDVGSNIGLSALYFLLNATESQIYLFEPNSENVAFLTDNLKHYSNRYQLFEKAAANQSGRFQFGIEYTGVYGSLVRTLENQVSSEGQHYK